MIDLDTIAALGRTVAERSHGPGLAPVLDRQWAANFRRRHKMSCLKKITTERLPPTVCDLALDNKWRREFLDLVEQPQKYGVRIPEGEPQSLPAWVQFGLDETPLQYAPKLRGGYAAGDKQVRHYSSADKRQATATPVVNREGTEIKLANLYYFVARTHIYVFFGRARRSHVSNVGDQVINPGMRAWLRDRLSVVPGPVSDSEEASEAEAEADEASGAGVDDNIDVLSVPSTPPVQRAAKRRVETRLDRLAERFRAAPGDVHAQAVARENRQRAREAREAVQTSDDEGSLSCAVLLTMNERE